MSPSPCANNVVWDDGNYDVEKKTLVKINSGYVSQQFRTEMCMCNNNKTQ